MTSGILAASCSALDTLQLRRIYGCLKIDIDLLELLGNKVGTPKRFVSIPRNSFQSSVSPSEPFVGKTKDLTDSAQELDTIEYYSSINPGHGTFSLDVLRRMSMSDISYSQPRSP
jgi:hypothetical protein